MSEMKDSKTLKIPFIEIQIATKNFTTFIGKGGYGPVYKGELRISGKPTTVAVKRLNGIHGQGSKEFLTEIDLLSGQHHPNIVSLLGFCDEGEEKIIVYEFAGRGSFDQYIKRTNDNTHTLAWLERLKICADAACGLDHLHNHAGEHQSIIHRDIKSANILINSEWVAKVSDFGLSKLCLAGLDRSAVISHPCGTHGYCEPEYRTSGVVTTKSDVYSFGMVLFEALSGNLCHIRGDDDFLLSGRLVKDYYKQNKMVDIVDPCLREQMSPYSKSKFLNIAYKCLHDDRGQRPSMDVVKKELEETLEIQKKYELKKNTKKDSNGYFVPKSDFYWKSKLPQDWEEIIKMTNLSHEATTKKKLFYLLHKGILFDEDNKVFWINDDGNKCLLISARKFLGIISPTYPRWVSHFSLRFSRVAKYYYKERHEIHCQIKTSMLSLGTMYAARLIFKYSEQPYKDLERLKLITIKWKMEDLSVCSTHTAELIANNWYKIKMWHFINRGPLADFDIVIEELSYFEDPVESELLIQGVEFYPVEMHEETSNRLISDQDEYFQDFLTDNGQLWFSLCRLTSRVCCMLSATTILPDEYNYKRIDVRSLSESRFGKVIKLQEAYWYTFECGLRSHMFSHQYIYACYLVFKFEDNCIQPDDTCFFKAWYNLDDMFGDMFFAHLGTSSMNIPIIEPTKVNGSLDSLNIPTTEEVRRPKDDMERLLDSTMKKRKDGWMEVMLCKTLHHLENHKSLRLTLTKTKGGSFSGIIVEGVEFRPVCGDTHVTSIAERIGSLSTFSSSFSQMSSRGDDDKRKKSKVEEESLNVEESAQVDSPRTQALIAEAIAQSLCDKADA